MRIDPSSILSGLHLAKALAPQGVDYHLDKLVPLRDSLDDWERKLVEMMISPMLYAKNAFQLPAGQRKPLDAMLREISDADLISLTQRQVGPII